MIIATLNSIKPGQGGIIRAVGGQGAPRRRLLDMGLAPHTSVRIDKVTPMGDPVGLDLRGYVLTLCLKDVTKIRVDTEGAK